MEPIATLEQLPLGNAIPADAQVLGSQLVVNVYQRDVYTTPLTVSAYGLKRSFTANATWNAYDGVNPWQTPGSDHDPACGSRARSHSRTCSSASRTGRTTASATCLSRGRGRGVGSAIVVRL